MSKNVDKFRKNREYTEEYAFKTNVYERKKRDKELEQRRSARHNYADDFEYGAPQRGRK